MPFVSTPTGPTAPAATASPPITASAVTTAKRRVKIRARKPPLPKTASVKDRMLLMLFWSVFISYTAVILLDTWIVPKADWCPYHNGSHPAAVYKVYPNPDSKASDPCYYHRSVWLLGLNPFECDFGRRMLSSILYGAAIGFERKAADRPAGIRTMSLVCLGACLFTMAGQFAFRASTQSWDAARVSAAVPSGVGFLGSALIWKETFGQKSTHNEKHQVHGLTTASSVWLSASVGIGAGGALFLYCTWAVVLVVFVLRLGPRLALMNDYDLGAMYGISSASAAGDTSDWDSGGGGGRGGRYSERDVESAKEDVPPGGRNTSLDDEDEGELKPLSRQEQLEQIRQAAAAASSMEGGGMLGPSGLSSSFIPETTVGGNTELVVDDDVTLKSPAKDEKHGSRKRRLSRKKKDTGMPVSFKS